MILNISQGYEWRLPSDLIQIVNKILKSIKKINQCLFADRFHLVDSYSKHFHFEKLVSIVARVCTFNEPKHTKINSHSHSARFDSLVYAFLFHALTYLIWNFWMGQSSIETNSICAYSKMKSIKKKSALILRSIHFIAEHDGFSSMRKDIVNTDK